MGARRRTQPWVVLASLLVWVACTEDGRQPTAEADTAGSADVRRDPAPEPDLSGDGDIQPDVDTCPDEDPLWDDVPAGEFVRLQALDAMDFAVVNWSEPVTYWELRQAAFGGTNFEVVASAGEKCGESADVPTCTGRFDGLRADQGFAVGCLPGACFHYLAINQGEHSSTVTGLDGYLALMAPIENPIEAALVAHAYGHTWRDDDVTAGGWKAVADGFELLVLTLARDCDPVIRDRSLVKVASDGIRRVLRQNHYDVDCGACI